VRRCGLDSFGSGEGPLVGSCDHSNEPSGSIKGREFLHLLNRTLFHGVSQSGGHSVGHVGR
jgi:hypothetical protein